MATLILQAAGVFLGGFLGPVGTALGGAAGSLAGYLIDRSLINSTLHHKGPRLSGMQPFTAEEGAPIPRVYGAARIGGTLIWATRFQESRRTERDGFKGGPRVTTYSYFANAAFGLCEGEIAGIRRVWADGREVDLTQVDIRIHRGAEDQSPDALVEAKQGEGNAPGYRGTAYAVLERFPLGDYGNRLPQMQFEVLRPVGGFGERITAITLIPGSTEHGLATDVVTRSPVRGETETINRHMLFGETDLDASLDELAMLCPNLKHVALVVTWFGDDLRAGSCKVYPAKMDLGGAVDTTGWTVSGETALTARAISVHGGAAAYGGTPSDKSVIQAIAAIKDRGWKVTLYPFVMMDVPAGNELPDPHGGDEQAAYPWRGRITCYPGPAQAGTADRTSAARAQVEGFFGDAEAGDFNDGTHTVGFAGDPDDWGYRRLVLHYAHLSVLAGGVDAFLIGSELRGLTTLRDETNAFPFVEQLVELAGDVRAVVGPTVKLTYGADWSEYFGHHPASGDVFFHLDPLWASADIDAVGIDNYMPLSDWRDEDFAGGNPDGFASPYDPDGLRRGIASGEGFDWHYADVAGRNSRTRIPITDGLAGKPWVFRYKDIQSWWANPHHDRVGGMEAALPTAWVPASKPIWLTELGCAAVDKGPNQPNVFPDPKSSENALPYFSNGGRSDLAQRRFLAAHLDYWVPGATTFDPAGNPLSEVYGGRMLDPERIYGWAWDARPFPAFPLDREAWKDGENWLFGHWLNGRMASVAIGDLIEAILNEHGIAGVDARAADGVVDGYLIAEPSSGRDALSALVELFDLSVAEIGGVVRVRTIGAENGAAVEIADPVAAMDGRPAIERTRGPDHDLPSEARLGFGDALIDYQAGAARAVKTNTPEQNAATLDFPGGLQAGQAEALAADWLRRAWVGRETIRFATSAADRAAVPGGLVSLPGRIDGEFVVSAVEEGLIRTVEAQRVLRAAPFPDRARLPPLVARGVGLAGRPLALFLDLPMVGDGPVADRFRVAIHARPWRSQQVHASPGDSGFEPRSTVSERATVGELAGALGPGREGRLDEIGAIDVRLYSGALASVPIIQLLNGANALAIRSDAGPWEVVQFREAEETAPSLWRLTGLLRGQLGTGDAAATGAAAGADVVLLDAAARPAGLRAGEAGLSLNWKVGPAGHDLTGQHFVTETQVGGVRAALPLSPVHLRAERGGDGSFAIAWIRRGRIDADSWLGTDIPLGEAAEHYVVRIAAPGGAVVRTANVVTSVWTYGAAMFAADFAVPPDAIDILVRQVSQSVGEGLPAFLTISTS